MNFNEISSPRWKLLRVSSRSTPPLSLSFIRRAGTSRRHAFAAAFRTPRASPSLLYAPPRKWRAHCTSAKTRSGLVGAMYRDIFQLRDTQIRIGIARNNNRWLSLNQKLKLLSSKTYYREVYRGEEGRRSVMSQGWRKDNATAVDEAGTTPVPASNLIRDKIMPDIFLRWRTEGRQGGREEGTTRIEDELSLSCHLVLRRNWNGVRSTITLAFARDRVSGVRVHAHVHAYTHTRAHNRRLLSDEDWQWRLWGRRVSGVACIYMKTRQYDTYFAARSSARLLLSPPLLRVARHSLVTSGLYSRKNIRGKTRERAIGR